MANLKNISLNTEGEKPEIIIEWTNGHTNTETFDNLGSQQVRSAIENLAFALDDESMWLDEA